MKYEEVSKLSKNKFRQIVSVNHQTFNLMLKDSGYHGLRELHVKT